MMYYTVPSLLLLALVLAAVALRKFWFKEDGKVGTLLVGEGIRAKAHAMELVCGSSSKHFAPIGWVLDSRRNAANRFQRQGQFVGEREECLRLAEEFSLPTFEGRIHSLRFYLWLWWVSIRSRRRIRFALMAGFGWRVRRWMIDWVCGWWLNTHPSPKWYAEKDVEWPNDYRGPQPYQLMYRDRVPEVGIVLHAIDEEWDAGTCLAQSDGRAMWEVSGLDRSEKLTQAEVAIMLKAMHERMAEPSCQLVRRLAPLIAEAILSGTTPEEFAKQLKGAGKKAIAS